MHLLDKAPRLVIWSVHFQLLKRVHPFIIDLSLFQKLKDLYKAYNGACERVHRRTC